MTLSLIDKIIRIPPTCNYIMQGEEKEEVLLKIPAKIMPDKISNATVSLLLKNNDKEVQKKELAFKEFDGVYNIYTWKFKKEYTQEPGFLTIQIEIVKNIAPSEEDDVDPDMMIPYGDNTNGIWYSYKNFFLIKESLIEETEEKKKE